MMLLTILGILFICILFLPLSVKKVERNIEVFLLVMAVIAVTASHYLGAEACWTRSLVESSLVEPVKLTVATLIFGIIFRMLREPLKRKIVTWESILLRLERIIDVMGWGWASCLRRMCIPVSRAMCAMQVPFHFPSSMRSLRA